MAEVTPDGAAVGVAEHEVDDPAADEREDARGRADDREADPARVHDVAAGRLRVEAPAGQRRRRDDPRENAVAPTSVDAARYAYEKLVTLPTPSFAAKRSASR